MAQQTFVKKVGPITIKCNQDWTPCQREQACSKVRRMHERCKAERPRGLRNISKQIDGQTDSLRMRYLANREEGNKLAAKYQGSNYAADCMKPIPGRAENNGRPTNADHVLEIQFGGAPGGPFMVLDAAVNKSIGTQLNKCGNVTHLTGVKAQNCAPEC
ncbi:hypothetical protein VARIO8X_110052 [Burkholderiales bacterium 8X]|nr:hypothetical protein VARIO8X_110052 [Burkholderiales bacterium 8X]